MALYWEKKNSENTKNLKQYQNIIDRALPSLRKLMMKINKDNNNMTNEKWYGEKIILKKNLISSRQSETIKLDFTKFKLLHEHWLHDAIIPLKTFGQVQIMKLICWIWWTLSAVIGTIHNGTRMKFSSQWTHHSFEKE